MFSEHTNCAGCHHHNPIQCSKIARPYYHLLYSSKTKKMKNNNNRYDDDDDDDDDDNDDEDDNEDDQKNYQDYQVHKIQIKVATTRNKQRNDTAIQTARKYTIHTIYKRFSSTTICSGVLLNLTMVDSCLLKNFINTDLISRTEAP